MKIPQEFSVFIKEYKKAKLTGGLYNERRKQILNEVIGNVKWENPIDIQFDRKRGGWYWLLREPPVWNFFEVLMQIARKSKCELSMSETGFVYRFGYWICHKRDAYALLKLLESLFDVYEIKGVKFGETTIANDQLLLPNNYDEIMLVIGKRIRSHDTISEYNYGKDCKITILYYQFTNRKNKRLLDIIK